eukprot:890539-Karenia_brevis.AAC.1
MACKVGGLNNVVFFNSSPTTVTFWTKSVGKFVIQMSCVLRIVFILVSYSFAQSYCTGQTGLWRMI